MKRARMDQPLWIQSKNKKIKDKKREEIRKQKRSDTTSEYLVH